MALLPPPTMPTVDKIYEAYEAAAEKDGGGRKHLGASIIGHDCERYLWLTFRWAAKASFAGRMLRLFETGHLQEHRLIADLRRAGVNVFEFDESTGDQFTVSAVRGHFGGSLDGVGIGLHEKPDKFHVIEYKSHNDKSFKELQRKGVEKAKFQHYCQMTVYMHLTGIDRAFYLAVNKNDESLYSERIRYDPALALRLVAKAERIIDAPRPPQRISDDPEKFPCSWCSFKSFCHEGAWPLRNCRTCIWATPADEGLWHCGKHDRMLDVKEQRKGCSDCRLIPDLVPGEQVDAACDGSLVSYLMPDGEEWVDGSCNVIVDKDTT